MLIESLSLTNFLSFAPDSEPIELGPLNVFIGPNGSGKSNLIEAIRLLQWAPRDLTAPLREGGGAGQWFYKGPSELPHLGGGIRVVVSNVLERMPRLSYRLDLVELNQRIEVRKEVIESAESDAGSSEPFMYFGYEKGGPILTLNGQRLTLAEEDLDRHQSMLAQMKDPLQYREMTILGSLLQQTRIYREWSLGRDSRLRSPQKADMPNEFLAEDGSNLGLILNRLRQHPTVKRNLLEKLCELYDGIEDFDIIIEGGTVQVFLQEGTFTVPAPRLSDGTLRYLCLLSVLCHPKPPRLTCIEEPELGLHPDILPSLANLLREASERTQLIVTTHSDVLIDALTETPEVVIVCEKHQGATSMRRLDKQDLGEWLEKYSLGNLWTRGDLGGTRW